MILPVQMLEKIFSGSIVSGSKKGVFCMSKEEAVLRVGIVSDVQGYSQKYDWGMHNLERAFALLAEKSPQVLINGGDLADNGQEDVYAYYKALVHKYFAPHIPIHAACAGNHDYSLGRCEDKEARYKAFCEGMDQKKEDPCHQVIGGFDFITLSEDPLCKDRKSFYSPEILAKLEECIQKAVSRDPDKFVFVITHFPPSGTMTGSRGDCCDALRLLFNKYPQVFSISSHTHVPLEDERNLWQGEFTALQTASLSYGCSDDRCYNMCNGILPYGREAVQCLYMEIFSDRVEIHRYNVEDAREIKKDSVWKVPYPYNAQTAPYNFERQAAKRSAPYFVPGTQPYLRYDFGYLFLLFDQALHEDFVHFYKVRLHAKEEDGSCRFLREERYIAPYYRLERNQDPRMVIRLPGDSLESRKWYKAEIIAVESFGKESAPLEMEFQNPCGGKLKDAATSQPQE